MAREHSHDRELEGSPPSVEDEFRFAHEAVESKDWVNVEEGAKEINEKLGELFQSDKLSDELRVTYRAKIVELRNACDSTEDLPSEYRRRILDFLLLADGELEE